LYYFCTFFHYGKRFCAVRSFLTVMGAMA
jgi:hypothetical protein